MRKEFYYDKTNEGNGEITNKRKCTCVHPHCNRTLEKGEGYGVYVDNMLRYVCYYHKGKTTNNRYHANVDRGYNVEGTTKSGIVQKKRIGIEVELYGYYNNSIQFSACRSYLDFNGVLSEHDGSVDMEHPTQIQEGLAKISKIINTMEGNNWLQFTNNEECGAHIHAGTEGMEYIRRFYHGLFIPLCNYIKSLPTDERVAVFGSDFRYYANTIYYNNDNDCTNPMCHGNFINVQHDGTIEFRLPRIASKIQYLNLIEGWREASVVIDRYFIDVANNYNGFFEGNLNFRKGLARNTAKKIVNVFEAVTTATLNGKRYRANSNKYNKPLTKGEAVEFARM